MALQRSGKVFLWLVVVLTLSLASGCVLSLETTDGGWTVGTTPMSAIPIGGASTTTPIYSAPTRPANQPKLTPTPDAPHALPQARSKEERYVVQSQDTLGKIAQRYGVDLDALIKANNLTNPNLLAVGQSLIIPVPSPQVAGPAFKLIPDGELVYSPATAGFPTTNFINSFNGYLSQYTEEVDNKRLTGAEIVAKLARDHSVNPRVLLAVLEYSSGWLTKSEPDKNLREMPIVQQTARKGLYLQLNWTANQLNRGYYLWRSNAVTAWVLADGSVIPVNPTINAGTAGVQQLFSLLYGQSEWRKAVSAEGFFATYNRLFGYPFDYAADPLIPAGISQPTMQLPIETGAVWSFTGGPHGGWGDGSAWAGLDFAPPGEGQGCATSQAWIVASAAGKVVRSEYGVVVLDLDGDGVEQTGWTVLYLHMATQDRIAQGTVVKAGQRLGHPSCEGGISNGTHVHMARRYNGEWIPADGSVPFNLDGWISSGDGQIYNGYLKRNGQVVEAWDRLMPENQIQR